MAIRFGNVNAGGGGGAGQLWKLNGAAPNDISLNAPGGASGILSQISNTRLMFKEVAPGVFYGGFFTYESGSKYAGIIAGEDVSQPATGSIIATDTVNGALASRYATFDSFGKPVTGGFVSDNVSASHEEIMEAIEFKRTIANSATNDKAEERQTQDALEFQIYVAGVEVYRVRIDAQGFALYANAGADLLLQITETGEILINQTQPATGLDNTIIARFPVHDEAGILIGYAPLMVDP